MQKVPPEQSVAQTLFIDLLKSPSMAAFDSPKDVWGVERLQAMRSVEALHTLLQPPVRIVIPPASEELHHLAGLQGKFDVLWKGHFKLYYRKVYSWITIEEHLSKLMGILTQCEQRCVDVGVRFRNTIPCYVQLQIKGGHAGVLAHYIYMQGYGALVFSLKSLDRADTLNTVIHETAHYIHHNWIPGGYNNPVIVEGYENHKLDEDTGGSRTKRSIDMLEKIKADYLLAVKQWFKHHDPGGMLVRSKHGSKTFFPDFVYIPSGGRDQLPAIGYMTAFSDGGRILLEFQRRIDDYNKDAIQLQRGEDVTYLRDWLSTWVPSDYAKTNVMEWFAEVFTACALHPQTVDSKVLAWLEKVLKQVPTK